VAAPQEDCSFVQVLFKMTLLVHEPAAAPAEIVATTLDVHWSVANQSRSLRERSRSSSFLRSTPNLANTQTLTRLIHHGHIPGAFSPAVSSNPHIRFMFWIACPTMPLPRLSIAEITVTRLVRSSTASPMWHIFEPSVCLVAGSASVM